MDTNNRHAKLGAYTYPYWPLDMFDVWYISDSEEEGTEFELLAKLQQLAEIYTKHGYKVERLKTTSCKIQIEHTILIKDVYVKAFKEKVKSLYISVWVDK